MNTPSVFRLGPGFLFLLLFAASAHANTLHVSPDGDDSSPGDAAHPFQTISRAADAAAPADIVLISPGVYREAVGLTQSGTATKPIVFAAEKPGTAVITGADPLNIWTPVSDHPGQYLTDWPHDFIIDHNADGSPVRNHGAPAPIGCAEQILWQSHPLRQVMTEHELGPGCFWVDWQFHTLTVSLPPGIDPRTSRIEGCVRPYLFSPLEKYNVFADAEFITLSGLVFQHAANFAQRGGVILGNHWRADHCVVEGNSAGGMSINGNDTVIDHCIAQFNGFCGISGSGDNDTLQDCIVQGNNRKGFPPDWDGGGGKFTQTRHLRIVRHTSCENTGPGLWLDADNADYSITDSTLYGNHGLSADWQGTGLSIEISAGPGTISNNLIFSNTGAGILLAESERIAVEKNTLVDNGNGIELRAMSGRDNHQLRNVRIERNQLKEWRDAAIATSLGDWAPDTVHRRQIDIDRNIYDPPKNKPFFKWGDQSLADLNAVRSTLGLESDGAVLGVDFAHPLESILSRDDPNRPTIAAALGGAEAGSIVTVPAICRSDLLDDGRCAIFDVDDSCILLTLPTQRLRGQMQTSLSVWPRATPVLIAVRLDQALARGDVRATLVEFK